MHSTSDVNPGVYSAPALWRAMTFPTIEHIRMRNSCPNIEYEEMFDYADAYYKIKNNSTLYHIFDVDIVVDILMLLDRCRSTFRAEVFDPCCGSS